jgi:hypothetical protein
MFDNITLKLPRTDTDDLKKKLWKASELNKYSMRRYIGNLEVKKCGRDFLIFGSFPKYLNGENCTPLTRIGVEESIHKLEKEIGIDLSPAVVKKAEFGSSFIVKEKPDEYLRLFDYQPLMDRRIYSRRRRGYSTATYSTPTGSYGFIGYDKIKEMQDHHKPIPAFFEGKNVLRLEYKITRKKGIRPQFKRELTAYDLFDINIYRKFQALFLDAYEKIPKMGRIILDIVPGEEVKPRDFFLKWGELQRQSEPNEFENFYQRFKENGCLSKKAIEQIQKKKKELGNNNHISNTSPLIKELDAYVHKAALSAD